MACSCKDKRTKKEISVKEISFYIHQYNQKRYDEKGWTVLKIAHDEREREGQKKKGANDMNYMKTRKLNTVWLFISYEESSIWDSRADIVPA